MPTKEQGWQFALMIQGGMPQINALAYFYPDADDRTLAEHLKNWSRSKFVSEATLQLQGKAFQEMTLEEKIKYSLDLHYSQMAFFLYSRNYSVLNPSDKQKADTCRMALEAKVAGTSGQSNPLTQFWDDLRRGKVTLGKDPGVIGNINRSIQ